MGPSDPASGFWASMTVGYRGWSYCGQLPSEDKACLDGGIDAHYLGLISGLERIFICLFFGEDCRQGLGQAPRACSHALAKMWYVWE